MLRPQLLIDSAHIVDQPVLKAADPEPYGNGFKSDEKRQHNRIHLHCEGRLGAVGPLIDVDDEDQSAHENYRSEEGESGEHALPFFELEGRAHQADELFRVDYRGNLLFVVAHPDERAVPKVLHLVVVDADAHLFRIQDIE